MSFPADRAGSSSTLKQGHILHRSSSTMAQSQLDYPVNLHPSLLQIRLQPAETPQQVLPTYRDFGAAI